MEKEQIKHMVSRFLGWKLPENFKPDGGIMFMDVYDNGTEEGGKFEPVGTNLFDAMQTEVMIKYLLEGLPNITPESDVERLVEEFNALFLDVMYKDDGYSLEREELSNWIKTTYTQHGNKRFAEGREAERARIKPYVDRVRLDVDVIICDCGEPYKDSDLDLSVGELEQALTTNNNK